VWSFIGLRLRFLQKPRVYTYVNSLQNHDNRGKKRKGLKMKVTKSTLNMWHVADDSGKIVGRISKEKGIYMVYTRNAFTGAMEHFWTAISFKEAKVWACK
jgi:hypothetical protein